MVIMVNCHSDDLAMLGKVHSGMVCDHPPTYVLQYLPYTPSL